MFLQWCVLFFFFLLATGTNIVSISLCSPGEGKAFFLPAGLKLLSCAAGR